MYAELFSIISPIILCAAIGYGWARMGHGFDHTFISRVVLNIGAPCLIVSSLNKVSLSPEALAEVGGVCLMVAVSVAIIGSVVIKLLELDVRTYLPPLLFPNIGNMGLPLCLFAFGDEGLALGLAYFMLTSIVQFTIGIAMMSNEPGTFLQRLLQLFKTPIIYAIAVSLYLIGTESQLPKWLFNTVSLLGGVAIPLMLITLGYSLSSLKVRVWQRSLLFSSMRIGLGFSLALITVTLLDIEGVARGVILIQSSMPVAVFNYLFAQRFQRDPEAIAGMVVMSTLMAFILLPFLLSFAMGL